MKSSRKRASNYCRSLSALCSVIMQYAITSVNSLFFPFHIILQAIRVTKVSALGPMTSTRLLSNQMYINNKKGNAAVIIQHQIWEMLSEYYRCLNNVNLIGLTNEIFVSHFGLSHYL